MGIWSPGPGATPGNDTYEGTSSDDTADGLLGNDSLAGGDGNDTLYGSDGSDTLYGGNGADDLNGGTGDDTLYFTRGNARLDGGDGIDTLSIFSFADISQVALQNIEILAVANNTDLTMTFGQVNALTIIRDFMTVGTPFQNMIRLTLKDAGTLDLGVKEEGRFGFDVRLQKAHSNLTLGAGNDTVLGSFGDDTLNGGSGNDYLRAGNLGSHLLGGTGNDSLSGGEHDDRLYGGTGNDYLYGGGGEDTLYGGTGNDFLEGRKMLGGAGDDTYWVDSRADHAYEATTLGVDDGGHDLVKTQVDFRLGDFIEDLLINADGAVTGVGNALNNHITGDGSGNILRGLDGNDTLESDGSDRLYGGAGNDTYLLTGNNAHEAARIYETISGGLDDGGHDLVISSTTFVLGDFVEDLTLTGAAATGVGNGLGNVLTGSDSANKLDGMGGNDTLAGGAGNDVLIGGSGADDFRFAHFGDANGRDHVVDFVSGVDRLVFTAADFGWSAGHVLTDAEFNLDHEYGGHGQFIFDTATQRLFWDGNGTDDGQLVELANFDNGAIPTATDFVFA